MENIDLVSHIRDTLYYDETSPTFLRWKEARRRGSVRDCPAGSLREGMHGYKVYILETLKKKIPNSRAIWVLFHGEIPTKMIVDHIDGNTLNNSIENLRVISHEENMRNLKKYKTNKSGVGGVKLDTKGYNKQGEPYKSWVAYWMEEGKQRHKAFSINKYGNDLAYSMAVNFRENKIKELNKNGAGYTERHGKE